MGGSIQILKTSFSLLKNRVRWGEGGGGRASLPATGRRRYRRPPGGGGGDRQREEERGIGSWGRGGGGWGEGEGTATAMGAGGCSMGVKRLPEVGDDGDARLIWTETSFFAKRSPEFFPSSSSLKSAI